MICRSSACQRSWCHPGVPKEVPFDLKQRHFVQMQDATLSSRWWNVGVFEALRAVKGRIVVLWVVTP